MFQYSAKLLKKPDQCRAVYACSHLFWVDNQDGTKDGERCGTFLLVHYIHLVIYNCFFLLPSQLILSSSHYRHFIKGYCVRQQEDNDDVKYLSVIQGTPLPQAFIKDCKCSTADGKCYKGQQWACDSIC